MHLVSLNKSSLLVAVLTLLAFLLGFKKDYIDTAIASLFEASAPTEPEPGNNQDSQATPATTQVSGNPLLNQGTTKPATNAPFNPEAPAAINSNMNQLSPFSGKLDSIRQEKIDDSQRSQRNLYFEKLSEQMKQLRGSETIPPPPPQPNATAGTQPMPHQDNAPAAQRNSFQELPPPPPPEPLREMIVPPEDHGADSVDQVLDDLEEDLDADDEDDEPLDDDA